MAAGAVVRRVVEDDWAALRDGPARDARRTRRSRTSRRWPTRVRAARASGGSGRAAGPRAAPTSGCCAERRTSRAGGSATSPASWTAGAGTRRQRLRRAVAPRHRAREPSCWTGCATWATEEAGLNRLHLFVHEHNDRAAAFYRRYGFTETGRARRTSPTRDQRGGAGPAARRGLRLVDCSACCHGAVTWPDASTRASSTPTLLRGNPLGDPHERPLWVYLPPGYDDTERRRALPERLRHPGLHRPPDDVGQPDAVPAAVRRDRRPGLRRPAAHRRASSSTSTRGRRTAARSSSTRPAPAATTRTSATRSCRGSTRATAPSPTASRGRSAGSPAAASAR